MNILLAVTIGCFFVLYTAPLTTGTIEKGRFYGDIAKIVNEVTQSNGEKNNIDNAIVATSEGFGVFEITNSHVLMSPTNNKPPTFEKRKFDPKLPTWIIVGRDGGNTLNACVAGYINQASGGQTLFMVRLSTKDELQENEQKKRHSGYVQSLLDAAKDLGCIVIIQSDTSPDVQELWAKFKTTHDAINIAVVLDSSIGKGYGTVVQDSEYRKIDYNAVPNFEVIQEFKKAGNIVVGVDGPSAGSLLKYNGSRKEILKSMALVTKCDYAIYLYGFPGDQYEFMHQMPADHLFLLTNAEVKEAVKGIKAEHELQHLAFVVSNDRRLNSLTNDFYQTLSVELPNIVNYLQCVATDDA